MPRYVKINAKPVLFSCTPTTPFFLSVGALSPKQPPHPTLMIYFPVTTLLGIHQIALAFILQMICGQRCPRPPRQMV